MWRAEDRDILISKKIIPYHASRLLLKLTLWSNIHWYRKRNFQPKETDKSRIHGAERRQKRSLLLFTEKGAFRLILLLFLSTCKPKAMKFVRVIRICDLDFLYSYTALVILLLASVYWTELVHYNKIMHLFSDGI